jgi:deoxyinosine 3'endonuclease (endonuclease V)
MDDQLAHFGDRESRASVGVAMARAVGRSERAKSQHSHVDSRRWLQADAEESGYNIARRRGDCFMSTIPSHTTERAGSTAVRLLRIELPAKFR